MGKIQNRADELCTSWQPSSVTCVEVKEQIDQQIRENQRISSDELRYCSFVPDESKSNIQRCTRTSIWNSAKMI
jgi:hypothetical protein